MSWYAVVKLMESKYQEEMVLSLLVWAEIVWKWVRKTHVCFAWVLFEVGFDCVMMFANSGNSLVFLWPQWPFLSSILQYSFQMIVIDV